MRFLPYILAGFLSISFVVLKLYREIPMGKKIYADLSSLNKLLETPIVGSTDDSYYYFLSAYAYYKNFLPVLEMDGGKHFVSFRFLSSLVFVPFMWLFKGYFPLAYIIFFIRGYAPFCLSFREIGGQNPNNLPDAFVNLTHRFLPHPTPYA